MINLATKGLITQQKCSEDLESKKKELYFIKPSKEHESNELQLHLIQTMTTACLCELKENEKHSTVAKCNVRILPSSLKGAGDGV